jgi:hypothetical protein
MPEEVGIRERKMAVPFTDEEVIELCRLFDTAPSRHPGGGRDLRR